MVETEASAERERCTTDEIVVDAYDPGREATGEARRRGPSVADVRKEGE